MAIDKLERVALETLHQKISEINNKVHAMTPGNIKNTQYSIENDVKQCHKILWTLRESADAEQ